MNGESEYSLRDAGFRIPHTKSFETKVEDGALDVVLDSKDVAPLTALEVVALRDP